MCHTCGCVSGQLIEPDLNCFLVSLKGKNKQTKNKKQNKTKKPPKPTQTVSGDFSSCWCNLQTSKAPLQEGRSCMVLAAWFYRSYITKADLRLFQLYHSHLMLFLSLILVQRKENLFGRLGSYFSLSSPCLAGCMQYLRENRQREGKEWTVKN